MKDIIIAGAGGFGREVYHIIRRINKVSPRWNIKGFINDIPVDLKSKKIDCPVLGTIKDWVPGENEVFAMGVSSPAGKQKIAEILIGKGAKFETIIDPQAIVIDTAEIGEGCVIGGTAYVCDCAQIGRFVHVFGSAIGQDRVIGDFTTTTDSANIATGDVGKRCFISSHAVLLRSIGDDVFVGAGSVVMQRFKSGSRVFGVPAKKLDKI